MFKNEIIVWLLRDIRINIFDILKDMLQLTELGFKSLISELRKTGSELVLSATTRIMCLFDLIQHLIKLFTEDVQTMH